MISNLWLRPEYAQSNYWLNAVICPSVQARDDMLKQTNESGVMTRPIWQLMHRLPMFKDAPRGDLTQSEQIEAHLINIAEHTHSSVTVKKITRDSRLIMSKQVKIQKVAVFTGTRAEYGLLFWLLKDIQK